ncbi:glyoxylate reductase/D-3-phosphoglycerate dehydrogenase/(S)-sulfolactate dehydrogenase [Palleronia aestuarii]|uniref:Glyoxylate reductase/D-3-phosphoglycerate dehydrogenase/(S)-sulfolactate dehydrogenase n=1 Tax=Palleronia aestuarii TaxID=568105 RepID=A0A2W7N9Q6_9RHOB|nr:2-hydroxyacid dehydrogenase [Palleronia aestuarii]PZX14877.1 glyoxylate reductase/D-3-phosphoglycerate dehydrogenase/(S)-sulfolactate dehydrogenase [Palleronia aestuarii]
MARIVLLDPAAPERLDRIRPYLPDGWTLHTATSRASEDQLEALSEAEFAITGDAPVDARMMAVPGLRAVHKWGVGYDNIDIDAARASGVRVLRTTGSNAVAVAETTLGLILALGRNLVRGHAGIAAGAWAKGELAPSSMTLSGRTVGIVGLGYIGAALARLLVGFGCDVLYTKRTPIPEAEAAALGVRYAPLDVLLSEADVVTLNCELNDSTRNLIDRAALDAMKPGALLVNVARGGVLVEADLAEAIRSGHLAGAAIDVFAEEPIRPDNPLIGLDRVILTPHIGAVSATSFSTSITRIMRNLNAIATGTPPQEIDVLV